MKSSELQLLCLVNLAFGNDTNIREILSDRRLQKLFACNLDIQQLEKKLYIRMGKSSIDLWQWAYQYLQHALDVRKFYLLDNWEIWEALLQHPIEDCNGDQPLHTDISSATLSVPLTESRSTDQHSPLATSIASIGSMIDNALQSASRNMRAPQLAKLKFQWHNSQYAQAKQSHVESDASTSKMDVFSSYFNKSCTQGYVGEDLNGYVPQLSRSIFLNLRKSISHDELEAATGQTSIEVSYTILDFYTLSKAAKIHFNRRLS